MITKFEYHTGEIVITQGTFGDTEPTGHCHPHKSRKHFWRDSLSLERPTNGVRGGTESVGDLTYQWRKPRGHYRQASDHCGDLARHLGQAA